MKKSISTIISIIIAVCISAVCFSLPAFATFDGGQDLGGGGNGGTRSDYGNSLSAYLNALNEYSNGNISYEEFCSRTSNIATDVDVETLNRLGFKHTEDINRTVAKAYNDFGANASIYLHDWLQELLNGYTKTEQQSTTDLKGYGALAVYRNLTDKTYGYIYCPYITVKSMAYCPDDTTLNTRFIRYNYLGVLLDDTVGVGFPYLYYNDFDVQVYGDVRYEDGSQAPTNDEIADVSVIDFDTHDDGTPVTDKELEDLLKDIVESLENEMPDLSGTDEILKSIYYRLGKLDSDNDNDLLSSINAAIESLNSSISELSNTIETSLNDLKDSLSSLLPGDKDNIEQHEISGTLYNVIPLDKNWIQKIVTDKLQLRVEYQGKEYFLEPDGTLKLDDKYYYVDMNYASSLDEILYTLLDIRDSVNLLTEEEREMSFTDFFDLKLTDLKNEFDDTFAFKDNLKCFLSNLYDVFKSAVPEYAGG